jgi:hypothetical protein
MSGKYTRSCFKQNNSSAPHFEDPALGGSRHILVLDRVPRSGVNVTWREKGQSESLVSNFKCLFFGVGTLEFIS